MALPRQCLTKNTIQKNITARQFSGFFDAIKKRRSNKKGRKELAAND
ncbi:hypothetical protein [Mucilaginibacter sp.]|nr:hypothetical protein [Mucilaginibacter sp.]